MSSTNPVQAPLTQKHHFEILDGLRGIAAVAVVIFHFMEFIAPDYHDNFIAHAYLAVDFFFCLSGFVIAYAYDQKLSALGIIPFLKLRLIRLHPLVVIGSVIGLLTFVFDPFSKLYQAYSGKLVPMFVASCLMIPYPLVHERYYNIFHLNPPTWSLFWEYVANGLYALLLIRISNKVLWILTIIAAGCLIYEARHSTNLGVGFGGDNVIGGGFRAFFSFFAGVLVYRSGWVITSRLDFVAMAILLLIAFLIPFSKSVNWFVDPGIAIFYFPFLIALGAGARPRAALARICRFSGDISYPLYMTHYPFLWIVYSYMQVNKPPISQLVIITIAGTILLIINAYLIMRFLDIPIRDYLKKGLTKTP
ncbi:acyltransferase family protein [Spirosoma sp. KUDC1026]|uniref:acyltransferase family protein n=1 Tax=Spirosoma sp. KUDC1026 TaxID=2745947 RepID=UPI00159BE43C|nr:acyltransferase [Spirosoma sp. KUDC1026]QKZ14970.1 acyltransferase [Spirosoma sp. KUDC1026]